MCFALGVATPVLDAQRRQVGTEPWDGPDTAPWNTADATASGLDPTKLDQAARLAETTDADSLVVVRHGRIVFERYWNERGPDDVQQMYSATKSPFAFLVGRAVARGDITSIDQPLIDFVPELAGHRREVLTFRNVMAMESGLAHSTELDQGDTRAGRSQLEAALARGTTHGPDEYFSNFGNGGQIVVVVPSLDLVWVRTGRQIPSTIWDPDSTVAQLSAAVVAAVQP